MKVLFARSLVSWMFSVTPWKSSEAADKFKTGCTVEYGAGEGFYVRAKQLYNVDLFFTFLWSCAIVRVYGCKRSMWQLWAAWHMGRRHPAQGRRGQTACPPSPEPNCSLTLTAAWAYALGDRNYTHQHVHLQRLPTSRDFTSDCQCFCGGTVTAHSHQLFYFFPSSGRNEKPGNRLFFSLISSSDWSGWGGCGDY